MKTMDMTKGSPTRLMLLFALPVIITNLGQQFYQIADAAIVGRGVGMDALAAVGCTDWTYWVILWSVASMTQGFATFVARYFGKRDYRMMNKSIAVSAVLSFAIAVIFTVVGLVFVRPLLILLETPENILGDAVRYLSIMISGTVIVTGYNLTAAILRAFGDGKTPLIAMIMAAILNILLDLLFVMIFEMSVLGAALASIIAQTVAFLYCGVRIFSIGYVKLDREAWRIDIKMLWQQLCFGFPLAVQYMVINIGGMICQPTINLQGSAFIAGYTSVSKLYGLLESTAVSLGAAFTTFASQNYGAGNYDRLKKGVKKCIALATFGAAVIMAIVMPLRGILPQYFIDRSEIGADRALDVASSYLFYMVLFLPVLYIIYVYRGNFQSIGDSFWSMVSGFGEAAARIFVTKAVFVWCGKTALFLVEPAAWTAALVFVMIPYYICRSRLMSVKQSSVLLTEDADTNV